MRRSSRGPGRLKTYKGFPHDMPTTETINADLLAFVKGAAKASAS